MCKRKNIDRNHIYVLTRYVAVYVLPFSLYQQPSLPQPLSYLLSLSISLRLWIDQKARHRQLYRLNVMKGADSVDGKTPKVFISLEIECTVAIVCVFHVFTLFVFLPLLLRLLSFTSSVLLLLLLPVHNRLLSLFFSASISQSHSPRSSNSSTATSFVGLSVFLHFHSTSPTSLPIVLVKRSEISTASFFKLFVFMPF